LSVNFPDKLKHTLSLVQSMHGGKDYESQWGRRMAGSGPYAWMIGRRFEIAAQRLGYREAPLALRNDLFEAPQTKAGASPRQLSLF
jgi:DNA repair photolyase